MSTKQQNQEGCVQESVELSRYSCKMFDLMPLNVYTNKANGSVHNWKTYFDGRCFASVHCLMAVNESRNDIENNNWTKNCTYKVAEQA